MTSFRHSVTTPRETPHVAAKTPHRPHPLDRRAAAGNQAIQDLLRGGKAGEIPDRARMEAAFGADFSTVRARRGARGLDALGAHAATAGEAIAFASEHPAPATVRGGEDPVVAEGERLLSALYRLAPDVIPPRWINPSHF
jgi:hypothetical protein